jgi:hypothetical protein
MPVYSVLADKLKLSRKRKKIIYKYRDLLITESRFLYTRSFSGSLRITSLPICGVNKAVPVNVLFWAILFRGSSHGWFDYESKDRLL